MLNEKEQTTKKEHLLNKEELREFFKNIGNLYSEKQNAYNSHGEYKLPKEIDDRLKSLNLLKQEYNTLQQEANEYYELLKEAKAEDESKLLQEELNKISSAEEIINRKTIDIITNETGTKQNCLVEIRPGAGGIEAGLFARDLFQMYYRFAENKKWKLEVIENRADSLGNLSFISFLIKGENAFAYLKNEAGVHRVQRIPLTESKGRIQTSTASVVALPEVNEVAVKLENKDVRVDTYRSSGAGGQHVNTTNSAIRVTHLPTGISAVSQDGRSQHDNKEKALLILRSRIYEKYKNEQEGELGSIRNSAIGSGERAEKIRTYNYPQNRVTDHRIGLTINKLNSIIEGDLEEICQKLTVFEIENRIADFVKQVKIKSQT